MTKTLIAIASLLAISVLVGAPAASTKALGSPTAPIVIDLYSDFQCPHCKDLHDNVMPQLIAEYVNTGKVYLVRHYFILKFPYSRLSALYAGAAEKIGRYNEASDALFRTQPVWSQTGNVDQAVTAALSPTDAQKVRNLVKDPTVAMEVEKDSLLGTGQNVRSTPTMIFTHKGRKTTIDLVMSYSMLKRFLDGMLAQ
jgi:protein-disulfide isomerase